MISVDEEEQTLLATAYDVVRENQLRLHALAESARLLYQRRLNEWEEFRHLPGGTSALLNSHVPHYSVSALQYTDVDGRARSLPSESIVRDRLAEMAEKVHRAQRVARLLGAVVRQMEKQSAQLVENEQGRLQVQDEGQLDETAHDRVIHAHEQERLRLAREIHDGPAQILSNAIFEMEYFERLLERDPDSVKGHLKRLKSDMRDGLAEVRRFIFDLRPPALSEVGLPVALSRYAADFQKHFGISTEIDLPQLPERLSPVKEVAVFRIAQEALQNVQKHASASHVVVRGEVDPAVFTLLIEDNGRGFDLTRVASRHSRNLGLISMRERAELIGAQMQIASAPAQGTKISLMVPLKH